METHLKESQSAADYPLAHLKVLDFSRVLAGPFPLTSPPKRTS